MNMKDYNWRISYRSSEQWEDGRPVDILHDFYIPALERSVSYSRVAGYFRSTSLAAASQGFSAFVSNRGRARFIVGADLDPDDINAVLKGTEEKLIKTLNGRLDNDELWPAEVKRGVQLLAWMVANDFLEIRVAFRVHRMTGKAIPFESVEDGYVHEKWAVFCDKYENGLYISGSLNESRTALTINAENIDVHCDWTSETDCQRVEIAAKDFDVLWRNQNPGIRVLSLPAAVKDRLIKFSPDCLNKIDLSAMLQEIDGSHAAKLEFPPPSPKEWLIFSLLKDGPFLPNGRYVGMETAPVLPWPHQEVVARRLIDSWPYSYLLCDEVGLGKTIEAGLAMRSLYLAGHVHRVLIATPASLTQQWQREMATKFLLPFGRALSSTNIRHEYLLPYETEKTALSLYEPDLTIVSTGLLSRKERQVDLRNARSFDIALLDEAHYARRSNPTQGSRVHPRYGNMQRAVEDNLRKRAKSLWLATATPMQLHPVEVCDLIRLTSRVGSFQLDPTLTMTYYDIIGKIISGGVMQASNWEFLRRSYLALRHLDPIHYHYLESAVMDGASRLPVRRWLDKGTIPRIADRKGLLRLLFAASPLSRVMLRHTRPLLDIYHEEGRLSANLARRIVLPIPTITFMPGERKVYDLFQAYCEGLAEQMTHGGNKRNISAAGFILSFFRLRFASSHYAISETLRRRQDAVNRTIILYEHHGVPDDVVLDEDDLQDLIDDADDDHCVVASLLKNRSLSSLRWEQGRLSELQKGLAGLSGIPPKMTVLLRVLEERKLPNIGRIRQTVVFTRFFDTLTDIVKRLRQAELGMLVGTYSGRGGSYFDPARREMVDVNREVIKHRFLQGEIDVLVCTDAAAEGLNLQTADLLVNFDLPWNPMKVEQRIGRIDRIGQRHGTIYVLNLCYVDSAEQIVYGRLLHRLIEAGAIIGSQPLSLLPVTKEEFQMLAEGKLKEEDLERVARDRCEEMQKRAQCMEIPARDLFSIYLRLQQQDNRRSPIDMTSIWESLSESVHLRNRGCRVLADEDAKTMSMMNIPGIADGTLITASRETYESGIKDAQSTLRFASYGDVAFERILDTITAFEAPAGVSRISVSLPGQERKYVAYVAACLNDLADTMPRLIISMYDLNGLQIDAQSALTDENLDSARRQLLTLLNREINENVNVSIVEKNNEDFGKCQLLLDYLIIEALLKSRKTTGQGDPLFWREITALEQASQESVRNEGSLRVANISAALAVELKRYSLFDFSIPTVGIKAFIDASEPLLRSAVEAACRLADGMKEKKSELTTEMFLVRISREIERINK